MSPALLLVSFFASFLVSFLVPFLASFGDSLLVSAEVPCFFSSLFLFFICFFLFLFFYFSSFASFFSSSSTITRHANIIIVTNPRGLPLPYYHRPIHLAGGTNLYYANSEWHPPGCYPPSDAKPKRHLSHRVDPFCKFPPISTNPKVNLTKLKTVIPPANNQSRIIPWRHCPLRIFSSTLNPYSL